MSDKIDYLRDKAKDWSSKYIITYDKCYKCETYSHFRIDDNQEQIKIDKSNLYRLYPMSIINNH